MSLPFPVPDLAPAAEPDSAATRSPGSRPRLGREQLLAGLNDRQRDAVVHEGPPLLVVAGAGSGKTRVLTRRIAWLIAQRGAHPGSILAITFTNKAAAQMRARVTELVGGRAKLMWVSTFHSACVRILRSEAKRLGWTSTFSIYDQVDSRRLMTLVCRDLELDPKRYAPRAVLNWVSDAKNELLDSDAAAARAENSFERTYASCYELYQRRLREANAMDFDDLLMATVGLFRAFPEVRETFRRRFRHVLVDEYQDTNHAQYALVRELCAPLESPDDTTPVTEPAELMVVGDSDQSIYAFRGASIRNILEFETDFPHAQTVLLEQNYRSTQTILDAANAVISRNAGRPAKSLWSEAGAGSQLVGYVADDEHAEAQFVAEEVDRLGDEHGVRPADVAVFYRTNAQSRVFEEVFIRVGLPYKVVGGVRFYERKEVKDALAYLRVLVNPHDTVSLRRIVNEPKRGIGDRAQACVAQLADRERMSFWEAMRRSDEVPALATRSRNAVNGFVDLLTDLQRMVAGGDSADTVLEAALTRSGYLAELERSTDPQDETRVENLAELVAVAREFVDEAALLPDADDTSDSDDTGDSGDVAAGAEELAGAPDAGSLGAFLERVALVADADQIPDAADDQGVVTLMTLHTAKGLEVPVVFLSGLEDGVFPHLRALGAADELEEERRLAYVGLTRAEQRLYVSRAVVRSAWGAPAHNPASRFLDELPAELVDWRRTQADTTSWGSGPGVSGVASAMRRNASRAGSRTRASGMAAAAGHGTREVLALAPGERVVHDSFGLGTVVTVQGQAEQSVASVDFGSQGVKRLLLRYAPLQKL